MVGSWTCFIPSKFRARAEAARVDGFLGAVPVPWSLESVREVLDLGVCLGGGLGWSRNGLWVWDRLSAFASTVASSAIGEPWLLCFLGGGVLVVVSSLLELSLYCYSMVLLIDRLNEFSLGVWELPSPEYSSFSCSSSMKS